MGTKRRPKKGNKKLAGPERAPTARTDLERLTGERLAAALAAIRDRLQELESLKPRGNRSIERQAATIQERIESTVPTVFGKESLEHQWATLPLTRSSFSAGDKTLGQKREMLIQDLDDASEIFRRWLERLERIAGKRLQRAFRELALHPEIMKQCSQLFRGGHYADAVFRGCVAVEEVLKKRSGRRDLSGVSLVEHVLSPNSPLLALNDLSDNTDRNEQAGFMSLFRGAVLGLRNKRAHKLVQDSAIWAFESLAFLSLLGRTVDASMIVPKD